MKEEIIIQNLSDKELVQQLLSETDPLWVRNLQEELYNRLAQKIFHKCYSILNNREQAEDLTHDILIKIFLNLDKYRGKAPFLSWVMAIAQNHTISYLKKEKRLNFEPIPKGYEHPEDEEELTNNALLETKLKSMEESFVGLSESQRLLLMMRYKDLRSIKDIAKALQVGESAIKMRLKRSRNRLAQIIKKATRNGQ